MLGSECLKDGIEEILKITPNEFKAKSNEGHAWYKRRRVDFGNYRYSVLYQLYFRLARFRQADALGSFMRLADHYQCLQLKAKLTEHATSLRGDVIEVVLAECLMDGPAVPRSLATSRRHFNSAMNQYYEQLEFILHMIFWSDDGAPRSHQWLDADLFVKILCGAHAFHRTVDGPEREAILQNFTDACELALCEQAQETRQPQVCE